MYTQNMNDLSKEPRRLLSTKEAAELLHVPSASIPWRARRGELALPEVWLGKHSRRFRVGDVLLVAAGQRPLFKSADEPVWESPYSVVP